MMIKLTALPAFSIKIFLPPGLAACFFILFGAMNASAQVVWDPIMKRWKVDEFQRMRDTRSSNGSGPAPEVKRKSLDEQRFEERLEAEARNRTGNETEEEARSKRFDELRKAGGKTAEGWDQFRQNNFQLARSLWEPACSTGVGDACYGQRVYAFVFSECECCVCPGHKPAHCVTYS